MVCLLALYGGLNPENVFYVYLGTLTMVIFASGCRSWSRSWRGGRATRFWSHTASSFWLLVPSGSRTSHHYLGGSLWWVGPVNDWVLLTNPGVVWGHAQPDFFVTGVGFCRLVSWSVHMGFLLDGRASIGIGAVVVARPCSVCGPCAAVRGPVPSLRRAGGRDDRPIPGDHTARAATSLTQNRS